MPAPPSALRLPAAVRARARATARAEASPRPAPRRQAQRRLRAIEQPKRTPFPIEALEVA